MAFQIQGKLHKVFDIEQKTDSFQAREFILEVTETQYPQFIKFQLTQDKCVLIDDYATEDELIVHFDLRGREWKERYFTNLSAWKIDRVSNDASNQATGNARTGAGQSQQPEAGDSSVQNSNTKSSNNSPDFDDDIPF